MKNHSLQPTILLTATVVALLSFTACSREKRSELADKTSEAYADTKATVAEGWEKLKACTFEKRDDFSAQLKVQQAAFEANVSKLRAEYSEATASTSRRTAMTELRDSEADYQAKLGALGTATAATWNSARDNVVAAWDRLQLAYAKARAGN